MSSDLIFGAIAGFRLVTADIDRLTAFYKAIGFRIVETATIPSAEMMVLGLDGKGLRRSMTLGDSLVDLDCFDRRGRPYPTGATACDLIFQHLALVTDDAQIAWRLARHAGATPITRDGPVTLPQSSGGVTAVKFRDPEGHPLELLEFPPGAHSSWRGRGIAGIDHSAVSVADVGKSQRFYEEHGLTRGDRTLNQGPPQVALDDLKNVVVDVIPMNPAEKPPHLELLGYRHPIGRSDEPLAANDVAATRVVFRSNQEALVRDPDGHLIQLIR
jgi:catechol 2,3-dioxygenase-like lactoylglutathione lyase family enzyme